VRKPLFWLAILYVLVGGIYAWVTPALEKPDEHGHYGYILYLREYHALPPLHPFPPAPPGRQPEQVPIEEWLASEFRQPPLYYALVTVLTCWLPDEPDPDRMLVVNPYNRSSVPMHRNDNRNRFLHPPDVTPRVLAGRLVSLLFGLGTMLSAYFLAAQFLPKHSLVPLATAAIVGFQPTFMYISTAVNNDAAIAFFGAVTVTLLAYRWRRDDWKNFPVLLGAILGLASITKVSGLVFFPLVGLALLIIHRGIRPALWRDGMIIVTVALLIGGWWYARNALVYNDPLSTRAHAKFQEVRPLLSRLSDLPSIEYTYWANPSAVFVSAIPLDRALIWWGRTSLALLVLSLVFSRQSIRANGMALGMLLSWPLVFLFLLIVYWDQQVAWALGRLLFPAIAPTTLALVLGWHCISPPIWRRPIQMLCAGMVIVIGTLVPLVSIYPLYHPYREWQAEQVEHPVSIVFVDSKTGSPVAQLVGYTLPQAYALIKTYLPIELCWKPLGTTDAPHAVFINLLDTGQLEAGGVPAAWGRRETYPGLGNRSTDRWTIGKAFCDTVLVRVFPETPTPLGAAIEVGLTDPRTGDRLQAMDQEGSPITLSVVGRVPILAPYDLPAAKRPARYVLDDAIALADVQVAAIQDSLTLTLTWQSLQPVGYDAVTFVHLWDAYGNMLAQTDRQPLDGRFATSLWLPGQVITDVVNLSLGQVHDGPLVLNIGMYTWPSLERLPVKDAAGSPQRDDMMTIEVPRF